MGSEKPGPWLDVREAAEALGLGRGAVYQLVASKKLACYRIGPNGGRIRFRLEDIVAYVESCRSGPGPRPEPPPARRPYVPKYDVSKPVR